MNFSTMLKISPASLTGWCVQGGYGDWPFVFATKGQAISFFLKWAEKHQPCDVQIFNYAGNVERRISFPDGNHRNASGSDRRQQQIDIPFPERRRVERRGRV
jgi:hypothetical protein